MKPHLKFQNGRWTCLIRHASAAPAPEWFVGCGQTLKSAYETYETAKRIVWMMRLCSAPTEEVKL